jgi:ubiquinone/menaquinone biosynthesis C-methylase UbiE
MSDAVPPAAQQFCRNPQSLERMPAEGDAKFLHYILSIAGATPEDRVLDVACGPGACTLAFATRCRHVIGLDVSLELVRKAREEAGRRNIQNATFIAGELERMPFGDGTVDAVVCRFSFHHALHPERVFAEMARVAGPRGWMVVVDVTASEDPAKAALHNELERLCDPTHARALPASEFERIFNAHGFRVAMKIGRKARSTVEDWLRTGGAPQQKIPVARAMLDEAVDGDRAGLGLVREDGTIRLTHSSAIFVLERAA